MSIKDEISKDIEKAEDVVEHLMEEAKEKITKPWHKKVHVWIFIVFFIVIIILGGIYYSVYTPIKKTITLAQQTQVAFQKVESDLYAADFETAKKDIYVAKEMLEKLDANVKHIDSPLMMGYLRTQYLAVEDIVDATQEFSDGLYLLVDLTQDVLSNIEVENNNLVISAAKRKQVLEKFSQKTPELNGAKAQIDLSLIALDNISVNKLNPQLGEYVLELRERLEILRGFLDKSVDLSQSLPYLLGLDRERTYLFLLQNNGELRPTGGFIGTIGILRIKNGEITFFETENVYDYDKYAHEVAKIAPPEVLKKYLNIDGWYLRDSNWSPDFVESAQDVEYFFHREANLSSALQDYSLDGVMAITPELITDFLNIVGAVEINSFVFNSENFVDRLQYLVEVGYEDQGVPYWQRKNIIAELSKQLINRTEQINMNGWLEIVKMMVNNLNEKQILLSVKSPNVQLLLDNQNWSGRIVQADKDYLGVFDANLASLKSNSCVDRNLNYTLWPDKETGKMVAHLKIDYKNNCSFTWKSTRYRTYTRVYVPQGSKLVKSSGVMEIDRSTQQGKVDIYDEFGKTVFGGFISIEPGKNGSLEFEYELPENLAEKLFEKDEYSLYIQKQAGTSNEKISLNLNFPNKITTTYPSEIRSGWGDSNYKYTLDLNEDQEVKVGFWE